MVTVCQICGVSGYAELLVFCNNCQTSAQHRYCLDELPSQHEVISWSCEQCKARPSMVEPNQHGTMGHLKCQFRQTKRSASMQNIGERHESNAGFSRSSLMRFEKHSKNKRRKLILLVDKSAEATKEKLLEVKMPRNLSRLRGRLISGGGHLNEEIHANSTCQDSPVKNSCQLLALSQVEIKKTRQNTFLPFDLSVQLLGCPVWRGCFDVCNEEFGPLKACMSIKACEKVCNIVTKLPPVLQMTKLSRNEWPTSFNNSPPNDDCIALCFFSENSNAGTALNNLLDHITTKVLALRVVLDEAEMLVFSSIILPEYCQRFEARYYMWGAFRSRQDNSGSCVPTNNCLDSNKELTIRDFPPGFRHATEQSDNAENSNIVEQLVDKSKNSKSRGCSESACSKNQVNIDINLHHQPVQICSKPTADENMSQNINKDHVSDSKRRAYHGSACSKNQVNIHSKMQENSGSCAPTNKCLDSNKELTVRHFPPGFRHATEQCDNAEKIKTRDFPPGFRHATEQSDNAENRNIMKQLVDKSKNSKSRDCSESACFKNQVNTDINLHHQPVQICSKSTADEKMSQNSNVEHVSDSERREYHGSACSKSQVNIHSNMQDNSGSCAPTNKCLDSNKELTIRHFPPGFRHATEQCDNAEKIKTRDFPPGFRHATEQSDNAENSNIVEQLVDKSKNSKSRGCSESACSKNQVNIDINLNHQPVQICSKPTADENMSPNINKEHVSDSKRRECSKNQVNIHSKMQDNSGSCAPTNKCLDSNKELTIRHFPPGFRHATKQCDNAAEKKKTRDFPPGFGHATEQSDNAENSNIVGQLVDKSKNSKSRDCSESACSKNQVNTDINLNHQPVQICSKSAADEKMSQNSNVEHVSDSERREYHGSAFSKSQVNIHSNMQDNSGSCAPTNKCLDSNKELTIRHFPSGFRYATEQCDNAEKIKTRDFPLGFRHATEQSDNAENSNIVEQLVDKSKKSKSRDCSESACSENKVNIDINLHHQLVQICSKPTADEKMSQNSNEEHVSDSERREYHGSACSKSQVNIYSNMHHSDVPICSHPIAEGISWNRNLEHASDSKKLEYNGSACSKRRVNINSNTHHLPEQIYPNPYAEGRISGNRIIVHASDSKRQDSENQININSNTHHLPVQICPDPPAEERTSGNRNFEHASDSKRQNYDESACSKSQVNICPNIHHQISPIYTNPTAEERISQSRNFEHASNSKKLEYNGRQVNINSNMHPHPVQVCPNPSAEKCTPQNRNFAHASYSKRRDCSRSLCPESQININTNMHHHQVQICPNPTTRERMSQNRNIVCASENCYDRITDDCRTVKQQLANNSNSLEERVVQCLDGNPFCEISDDSSNEITKDRKLPMLDSLEYQGKHEPPNNAMHKHPSTGKMPQQGKELLNPRMKKNPVACILDAHKLLGFNYLDWLRNLKIVLDFEKLTYVLEHSPPAGVNDDATEEEKIILQKWRDDDLKAKYYMISSMSDELQKQYKNISHAYEIHARLDKVYGAKSRISRYRILRDLFQARMTEGSSVHDHVLKMINMVEKLEDLGIGMDNNVYIDLILQSLPESFSQFITNFLKNRIETSLRELLNMLSNAERTIKREASDMLKGSSKPKDVVESFQKKKSPKTKTEIRMAKSQVLSQAKCFHCGQLGHLKRNCIQFLKLNKEKI